jgi:hypothetical protein
MMHSRLFAVLAASAIVLCQPPTQQPLADNEGDLVGTWVSMSQGVITGPVSCKETIYLEQSLTTFQGFINPLNSTFYYPSLTGLSYSL